MFNRDAIVQNILYLDSYTIEQLRLLSQYANYAMDPISYVNVEVCINRLYNGLYDKHENEHEMYMEMRAMLKGIDPFLLRKIPFDVFRELFVVRDICSTLHYNYLKDMRMDENENISIFYNELINIENDLTVEEKDLLNMHAYLSNNSLLFLHNIYIHLNKTKHFNTSNIFDNMESLFGM